MDINTETKAGSSDLLHLTKETLLRNRSCNLGRRIFSKVSFILFIIQKVWLLIVTIKIFSKIIPCVHPSFKSFFFIQQKSIKLFGFLYILCTYLLVICACCKTQSSIPDTSKIHPKKTKQKKPISLKSILIHALEELNSLFLFFVFCFLFFCFGLYIVLICVHIISFIHHQNKRSISY